MSGDVIAQYRILGKIGEGGMGVVYQARDTRLDRLVALKFLRPEMIADKSRQRFLEEARSAANLQHPNICPVFDVCYEEDRIFYVMAFVEGETIYDKIRRGPLAVPSALDLADQIAGGLGAAHARGIVHRDIKSSNVIVTPQGHAYILDFGLALRPGSQRLTGDAHRVGTPPYMAPEQALENDVDQRADLWSLGAVLYEMLTGKTPFDRPSAMATLHAILYEQPPPLEQTRPGLPPDLQKLIDRALAKDVNGRFQSAAEFSSAIAAIRDTTAGHRTLTLETSRKPMPAHGSLRRRMLAGLVVAPLLGSATYLGTRLWLRNSLPSQKHIAVLPFEVIGNDESVRALADGLVEVLTAKLSDVEFPEKTLIVPASEVRSRKITTAAQAKRIYGINMAIVGSAQMWNPLAQLTVALVDADSLRQIGARTLDLDLREAIVARDKLLDAVLTLLQLHLSAARVKTQDDRAAPGAYADYLRGLGYLARYDQPGNVNRAIECLEAALRADPTYALAHAGLARAYTAKADATGDKAWSEIAVREAELAVKSRPDLAATQATLGRVYGTFGREDDAVRAFHRALQLDPRDGETHRDLAGVLENMGRFQEAETEFAQSTGLRPDDWLGHLLFGLSYERRGRFDDARQEFERAAKLTPVNGIVRRNMAGLYRIMGNYDAAVKELETALAAEPTASLYSALSVARYFQHRFPDAAAAVRKALDLDAGRFIFWGNLGMILKQIPGQEAKAGESLRRAIELGDRYGKMETRDYNTFADLAEYHARLGEKDAAQAELAKIPESARGRFAANFALVYELIGMRKNAIGAVLEIPNAAGLNEIKNDPSIPALWADAHLQELLRAKWKDAVP